ncbi:hypothetical protein VH13_07055 [Corynebacterium ulcerans]|uniref:Uncharacterized protein n=1 Tax=Corynebacterium ramonii TaxID=3026968 RepID=A0ABM5RRE7_9CORY|nr:MULTISPECIES: hypothetical protein [Corynebacterium]AIU32327.1 Hypothetical protein CulFRC11_0739 [Corynebacterium ramonii FRC0011]AKA96293.1 Hypothetical protein CUL131002_0750c [Corynebacterium ulcerans]ESU58375.1 hypothetical protein D881_04770 [Corynebacterium ulcerans NCTC 12077]KKO85517.1 hypothetical protein VH13_07055 [Corynebacterium ulcerans]KKO87733.1 hypothetical protein VH15_03335 [Corynebacterium ulcerans]
MNAVFISQNLIWDYNQLLLVALRKRYTEADDKVLYPHGGLYRWENRIRLNPLEATLKRIIAYCFLSGLESPQA